MAPHLDPLTTDDDRKWCARLLSTNDPWITLRRGYDDIYTALGNMIKERYVIRADGARAGVLILDMTGPFPGYIQTICIAPEARNRGLGRQVLAWAEERILRDSPFVFMCVSSFNPDALRLYQRAGFEVLGRLTGFMVDEHDELLLWKRSCSMESFRQHR